MHSIEALPFCIIGDGRRSGCSEVSGPGLVDVEYSLSVQLVQEVFIQRCDCLAHFGDDLREQTARKFRVVDVLKVCTDGRQRSMVGSLKEADDAGQFDATQSGPANLRRDRADVSLVASGTVTGERSMFGRFGSANDFDLLHSRDGVFGVDCQQAAATSVVRRNSA